MQLAEHSDQDVHSLKADKSKPENGKKQVTTKYKKNGKNNHWFNLFHRQALPKQDSSKIVQSLEVWVVVQEYSNSEFPLQKIVVVVFVPLIQVVEQFPSIIFV